MKRISLIAPEGEFSIVNLDLSRQMFQWVNENAPSPIFDIEIIGLSHEVKPSGQLYSVKTDRLVHEVSHTDVVIIPATFGNPEEVIKMNQELVPWVMKQYDNGADLASMCVGAFFLGSMGLLDGKRCSTHWGAANDFRRLYPKAILEDERIVSESDRIYTSGGALAFTNLLIYLLERYAGREIAIMAAKAYMIDIDRASQSPFAVFTGLKTHQDKEVLKAQEFIESHFQEKFTVEEICEEIGLGRRSFERRFKNSTANTIFEYLQRVRIEAAKKELENGMKTVSQVMYDVGYSDTKAFRDMFKRWVGMTPIEYRNRYNKEAVTV
ncbi:helix-turn-helix domain-containing protein [Fulvivirga sp. M361]|uniref:GlxA family transcriptional regulator n=1 Tax=Fulvivirga sp. M361 TaxID=2594266 RepID=UPI00117BD140|nr:helix-turn-helix domain-containing protein [Fulvivirga sp. M361]TRX59211.1 helix-turn-helix domain-containing protein [Fulvivirga sp. M361]